MIALTNFSFDFGGDYLFREANWHIKPGERIGLVGLNGTGKSTLLRIITGEYSISGGNITRAKDCTIGFLNQDLLSYESEEAIVDVAMLGFDEVLKLEHQLDKLIALVEQDPSQSNLEKMADVQERFIALDGYEIRSKAEKVLEGLGFVTSDLTRPLKEFSGGWRMRVMLAQLLLKRPRLLLLDEPTNHLDLPSIEWLENYLKDYEGTVVIVSHDRWFLNRMVTKIVEVAHQKLYQWPGDYDNFLSQRDQRDELQQRRYDNQQQFIRQQERLIDRFKAKASKASMAQSRMKMLDKLEKVEEVRRDTSEINIRFTIKTQPGKVICELKDAGKSYGDLEVLTHSSATIMRGDKIGLIGANGRGKSTLLKVIGKTTDYTGEVIDGHNVEKSFYAQHQLESLGLDNEILEELIRFAPYRSEGELRGILGCFMFTGDEVFKKIKVLSGGEKARVALAKTLLTEANFLLLDEPTNHLDMQSIELLTEALQEYKGTLVVVSHDRHFVSQVANKIWYIEDHQLCEYPGTYLEYLDWMQRRQVKDVKPAAQNKQKEQVKQEKKNDPGQEQQKELKRLRQQLDEAENRLQALKEEKEEIEKQMSDPETASDNVKINQLAARYQDLERHLKESELQYEALFEKVLELESA